MEVAHDARDLVDVADEEARRLEHLLHPVLALLQQVRRPHVVPRERARDLVGVLDARLLEDAVEELLLGALVEHCAVNSPGHSGAPCKCC